MKRKKLVVLTGAGMSAESGIPTFRGSDGLWEGYSIEEVASPQAWMRNPDLVLDFYNQRRKQIMEAAPNPGHRLLADLEKEYDVRIITQNIDNLHERAGSTNVMHLHGEIMKARSTSSPNLIYDLDHWKLSSGDLCERGSQLRPHIVWFGEAVPMIEPAAELVSQADILVIAGTSMVVYPAAGLIEFCPDRTPVFCIDPATPALPYRNPPIVNIVAGASKGIEELARQLKSIST
jgi:NAD-dependent deacetylase